jgi:eukaryotic-like serine/threonine-protein kinase
MLLWTLKTGGAVMVSPALSRDGSQAFVGSYDHNIIALDAKTGAKQWNLTMVDGVTSPPAVAADGKTVYFGSGPWATRPPIRHSSTMQSRKPLATREGPLRPSRILSVCLVAGIFKISMLYALDAKTGKVRWSYTVGDYILSAPRLSPDGSMVFVGCTDHTFYALDAGSGKLKWQYGVGGEISHSSPAFSADGASLYFGAMDGLLYKLDVKTGALKSKCQVSDATLGGSPVLSGDGKALFIGCGNALCAVNIN